MQDLLKAYQGQNDLKGRVTVLEQYTQEGHSAAWVEFEGVTIADFSVPVTIRSFHCECYFDPSARRTEADCPLYETMLDHRYKALTASFKEKFESGRRAFLPPQIEDIIEELVRMVCAGEFVEPDGRLRLRGALLRDVTLAKIIELPCIAARGHLTRYAAQNGQEVQDGILLEG